MKLIDQFPADENGQVLRQMAESGDDLSKPRNIDFTVVLPSKAAARKFAAHFTGSGYQARVDETGTVPELPWDVVVVKHMLPAHAGITGFEEELEAAATSLGGRNDGWGCFEQQEIH